MRPFKKKHLLIVVAVLLLVVALAGLVRKRKGELARMEPAKTYAAVVQVERVTNADLELGVRYLGEIVPVTEDALASKVSGFIDKIPVSEGEQVEAGAILVQIDDREVRDRLRQIAAQIQEARDNLLALQAKLPGLQSAVATSQGILQRNEKLFQDKAIAREELDISQKDYELVLSELKATQKSIEAAKSSIGSLQALWSQEEVLVAYTTIRAPFSGIVSEKILSIGDLAVPGKAILKLVRPDAGVKVEVKMALEDFAKVRVGAPATLLFDEQSLSAPVSAIYPSTGPASLGMVNIRLPQSPFHLPFHSRVKVRLVLGKAKGLIAPISCLLHRGGKTLVVKVDSANLAQLVPVELCGKNETHFCFHTAQISVGDQLASGRESRLMHIFSGQQVEVVP